MDEQSVSVKILDRPYKLKIGSADEQYLRKAAELIDMQARDYGRMYAHQDRQDLLAMVALTQITRLLKVQAGQQFKDTALEARLTALNQLLDEATQHSPANK